MRRMKKIGNMLGGLHSGTGSDVGRGTGSAKQTIGNMEDGTGHPGMAKTGYSGPMSKFGGASSGSRTAVEGTSHLDAQRLDGAPNHLAGVPGKGNVSGRGWPKALKNKTSAGGTDWPNETAAKGPAPDSRALAGTPKGGAPPSLSRGTDVAGHGPTFKGRGSDTGLVGANASLPGKGWPKSLRRDVAGHGTLAG